MSRKLQIAYLTHSIRSDWNNGNAHFLRGLLRSLREVGHHVEIFEPAEEWSLTNLRSEEVGDRSLRQFGEIYPDLLITTYGKAQETSLSYWRQALRDAEIVILHEWNPPQLSQCLLSLREELGFRLLFHDTHHRASSAPEQVQLYGLHQFDGVLAFGEALRQLYMDRFGIAQVWTLHEAADTSVFHPIPKMKKTSDVVWVGNWGDDERSSELCEFLLLPAKQLAQYTFTIYGVRYPARGLDALRQARVIYGGYLPNLDAPSVYGSSRLTVHIPRQQYSTAMHGIPTIRVFEALACGIPLISAPWCDSEELFREDDFRAVTNTSEMKSAMQFLLEHPKQAEAQALRGLETVLAKHTCRHRAEQLTYICEDLLR